MQLAALLLLTLLPAAPAETRDAAALFRQDFLPELAYRSEAVLRLAEAMPAEKYAWRPGPGVRSVGEAYVHIANGNQLILMFLRNPAPAKAEIDDAIRTNAARETKVTDKAAVIALLKESFDQVRAEAQKTDSAGLARNVQFFGRTVTARGIFGIIVNHACEHLGQEIAYARVNGVVPPWSR